MTILHQKKLFTESEVSTIKSYVTELKDRIIPTRNKAINNGKIDPVGGHNLAEHLPWSKSDDYNWISDRILSWLKELELPIENLGYEFIVQKYTPGLEFKPHTDDVMDDQGRLTRKRYYTILMQLSNDTDYSGGLLFVDNDGYKQIDTNIGTVCIFGTEQLHYVSKIETGERWSCTIFLEKDAITQNIFQKI